MHGNNKTRLEQAMEDPEFIKSAVCTFYSGHVEVLFIVYKHVVVVYAQMLPNALAWTFPDLEWFRTRAKGVSLYPLGRVHEDKLLDPSYRVFRYSRKYPRS